jgi:hypothetical protein
MRESPMNSVQTPKLPTSAYIETQAMVEEKPYTLMSEHEKRTGKKNTH